MFDPFSLFRTLCLSSFAIILMGKRELVACYNCSQGTFVLYLIKASWSTGMLRTL